ncbi:HEAT repeat-containing protein 6 [Toxorhynchites rutilus septentrionalis]|uniref:HEAT repeat-containing protein 6 n=1 Tax=Toxorhynchites rutilus septentrionalis TaxID=329112 RepID=UPI00247A4436|nr:HEAT repeat-containing protein 6 [Toxorhynchites rutilus septentrionalis]
MELEQQFVSLSTKFLFFNCGSQFSDYRNELNTLLNELNGLDYKNQQITDTRAPIRLAESLVNIPTNEDTLIVKACCLLRTLVYKQKIVLPPKVAKQQVGWLLQCLERCFYEVLCEVLGTLQFLLKQCADDIELFHDSLVSQNGVLINLLIDPDYRKVDRNCVYDSCSPGEIYLAALLCLEAFLNASEGSASVEKYFASIGDSVLSLVFRLKSDILSETSFYSLMISALNCLRLVSVQREDWLDSHIGQLLGIAKAYMMYGIPSVNQLTPHKIMVSQQGVPEPQFIPINKGGKVPKTRKTRTPVKGKGARADGRKGTNKSGSAWDENGRQPYTEQRFVLDEFPAHTNNAYRTSDSDFSESESSRAQIDRHKLSKLRHSALTLICTITKAVEKKVMFGYWHALFPDESRTAATVSLLNCVLKDPSPKCRIAAIQATTFMLHKSKPFLIQAESSKKVSVSFTPFSIVLGNMIIEMYEMLTQALADESDLSVLTQILKCLTVFIHATPFNRLRPGIVTKFVRFVRILTRHKDPTIKVGALMVMGFLITVNEITPEISEVVGIRKTEIVNKSSETRRINTTEALSVQFHDEEEECLSSDDDKELESPGDDGTTEPSETSPSAATANMSKVSWLLQIALEYLGVTVREHKVATPSAVMPVRMECLQVLSAMTSHYSLLADSLPLVAAALKNSFNDAIPEIKLYAGRVLDLLGHAINTSLLMKVTVDDEKLNDAVEFWAAMIPTVKDQIQNLQQNPSLRAICCDALGNIGVHVFEKLPRDRQIVLVVLLTGCTCDDDSGVSSAAVRALSVYTLFPSLRNDFCYIENTIDAVLRILKSQNVAARVKASWSLGNITDALVMNGRDPGGDHVGDGTMSTVLEAVITAAGDNDKVRCNAVRTIGNVLRMLRNEHLTKTLWIDLCQKSIEKLVQNVLNSNNVKVKWNACYAIGNIMRNELLFTEGQRIDWHKQIFPALCHIVINSNNFKVRINSAAALSVIENRSHYGGYFIEIWSSLLKALEQSDNLVDYNEYKHRDNLQEQLCLSLSHFLRLASREDLIAMSQELLPLFDAVKQNWDRVVNRILPEKSAKLIEANVKLKELEPTLRNGDARSAAEMISKCFHSEVHIL